MADDPNTLTIYRNDRNANILRVSLTKDGVNLTSTGGDNITADEYSQIASFATGHAGAQAFLAKVQARMAR